MKEYEAEKGRKENRKRIKNDGVRNWEKKNERKKNWRNICTFERKIGGEMKEREK